MRLPNLNTAEVYHLTKEKAKELRKICKKLSRLDNPYTYLSFWLKRVPGTVDKTYGTAGYTIEHSGNNWSIEAELKKQRLALGIKGYYEK